MWRFSRNSLAAGFLLAHAASGTLAGIVLDAPPPGAGARAPMRSIIFPSAPQSESAYLIRRSFAWRTGNGALLVHPQVLDRSGTPDSIRQLAVRNHLSRANAYRIGHSRK